jgi:hypothetical protein
MRLTSAFILVAAATSLSACGATGAGEASGTSATPPVSSSGTSPTVFPDDPAVTTTADRSRKVTANGTVTAFEGGSRCFTMRIEGQDYQLVGDIPGMRDGLSLTVTGYADPTMTTTCQAGPAFVVLSSTPG